MHNLWLWLFSAISNMWAVCLSLSSNFPTSVPLTLKDTFTNAFVHSLPNMTYPFKWPELTSLLVLHNNNRCIMEVTCNDTNIKDSDIKRIYYYKSYLQVKWILYLCTAEGSDVLILVLKTAFKASQNPPFAVKKWFKTNPGPPRGPHVKIFSENTSVLTVGIPLSSLVTREYLPMTRIGCGPFITHNWKKSHNKAIGHISTATQRAIILMYTPLKSPTLYVTNYLYSLLMLYPVMSKILNTAGNFLTTNQSLSRLSTNNPTTIWRPILQCNQNLYPSTTIWLTHSYITFSSTQYLENRSILLLQQTVAQSPNRDLLVLSLHKLKMVRVISNLTINQ